MSRRLLLPIAIMTGAFVFAGSALAFGRIRVSSSLQGLQESTRSGNWLLFDLNSADAVLGAARADVAPRWIAALGGSASVGYSATGHSGPQPANSWVTGTNPKVHSIFLRLRQRNGASERAFNAAEPGASMITLSVQAAQIPTGVDLVTVDMGTNDICDRPATSLADFRSYLKEGLQAIAEQAPSARMVVISIRNQLAVWDAVKMVPGARAVRTHCIPATTATGRPVLARAIRVMNHELANACARQPRCRYDGGAAFRIRWSKADVSSIDYFHPSLSGQRKIADAVWATGAITGN